MNRRKLMPQPAARVPLPPEPPPMPDADIELFARTLWGEAAGESMRGIEALAAVVMNRAALLPGAFDRRCVPELSLLERTTIPAGRGCSG